MLKTIILIVICIAFGFFSCYLYDNGVIFNPKEKKIKFSNAQKDIIKGLKEKKDAQLKEFNEAEERQRAQTIQNIRLLEEQYQDRENQLVDNYNKKELDLSEQFKQQEQFYNNLKEECSRAREAENIKSIQQEQESYNNKLNEIKDNYNKETESLKLNFLAFSEQINLKKENLLQEIESYENKQKQIIARLKEDEKKKDERDFYKIKLSDNDKSDIQKLKNIAQSFNKPDIIYKLIWEVYYKSLMEALFKRVLGDQIEAGGIYKITDITNEKIYIGRAVNFKERWRTHSKRGCGIEKIKGLLYDAMFEKGLENFTFEVVESCPKEQQAEKEKYWISFYHSDSWGYNQNKGG